MLGALFAAVLAVGPLTTATPPAALAATPRPAVVVTVRDTGVEPSSLTIAPGTEIVFHNAGRFLHRLMSSDGSIDTRGIEPGRDARVVVGSGATAPLTVTVTDEMLPGTEFTIHVVPGAVTPTLPTAPTAPAPPTRLAQTGSATVPLLTFAATAALCGLALASRQRRALQALVLVPTGRDHTTTLQRHHDDVLPRRTPRPAPGPVFSRAVLGTRPRVLRPSPPTTGPPPPPEPPSAGAPRARRRR